MCCALAMGGNNNWPSFVLGFEDNTERLILYPDRPIQKRPLPLRYLYYNTFEDEPDGTWAHRPCKSH